MQHALEARLGALVTPGTTMIFIDPARGSPHLAAAMVTGAAPDERPTGLPKLRVTTRDSLRPIGSGMPRKPTFWLHRGPSWWARRPIFDSLTLKMTITNSSWIPAVTPFPGARVASRSGHDESSNAQGFIHSFSLHPGEKTKRKSRHGSNPQNYVHTGRGVRTGDHGRLSGRRLERWDGYGRQRRRWSGSRSRRQLHDGWRAERHGRWRW